MNDFTQLILFISIFIITAFIANIIKKYRNNIVKLAKYKYITKGSALIFFGIIVIIFCIVLWYLGLQGYVFGTEKAVTGNPKSIKLSLLLLIFTTILSIYSIIRGISYIRYVIPKDKIYGTPSNLEFKFNVSRFKFIYASCLNPLDMSFRTAFAIWILVIAGCTLFDSDYGYSIPTKLIMLVLAACFQFILKPVVIYKVNYLYNANKNGEIITKISENGISRITDGMLIDNTEWSEVECVKYFKDYVVICSDYLDYIIFTNNDIEKNNIKLFYQLSRDFNFDNTSTQEKSFVETQEILKKMTSNAIVFEYAENKETKPTSTKIGGNPHVIEEFASEYPAYFDENNNKRPFVFVAQINCKEIHKFDKASLLPKTGILYFFCDYESYLGYVYYYDGDLAVLKELELPYDEDLKIKECPLTILNRLELPDYEDFGILHKNGYFFDTTTYYRALNSIYNEQKISYEFTIGKMLGYADLIEESVIEEALEKDLGKPFEGCEDEEIQKSANDWILLLQCNNLYGNDSLYFYIKKEDLKNKNFDDIYFSTQM